MSELELTITLALAAFLFSLGLAILLTRRNLIMMLLGLELMLNAANLNLVAFGHGGNILQGQIFALFVIVVAVCEAAVGIALVLRVYHHYQTSVPSEIHEIKEPS